MDNGRARNTQPPSTARVDRDFGRPGVPRFLSRFLTNKTSRRKRASLVLESGNWFRFFRVSPIRSCLPDPLAAKSASTHAACYTGLTLLSGRWQGRKKGVSGFAQEP